MPGVSWTPTVPPTTIIAPMPGDAARKMTREQLEVELKVLIIDALKLDETSPEDIDSEAPLASAGVGLDSIDMLELAMAVHRRFGITTEGDDAANQRIYTSVRSLAEFLEQQQARGAALRPVAG
ncbi:phosphopantetheine-binding protein [Enhygromyxa salina]|uniref:Acyl carrier protein n=1 Tax=Enhygromyxa salina TaxID=215803 RepID=A0A2S9XQT6_9BACT|nr:phosphopantetheine-binding protein [Enhygromyxa salina]PRP95227.1 acyl carrier protein [Enhygromyxa salina]